MAEQKFYLATYDFVPTLTQLQTVGPTVYHVMSVESGTLVVYAAIRIGTLFDGTTPNINVGDDVAGGGDIDGFIDQTDITIGTAALYAGYGDYFGGANGRLYTTADTIDLLYTGVAPDGGLEVTQGQATVYIIYTFVELEGG